VVTDLVSRSVAISYRAQRFLEPDY